MSIWKNICSARLPAVLLLSCGLLAGGSVLAQETTPEQPEPAPAPVEEPPPGPDLTVRSQQAISTLDRLTAELAELGVVDDERGQLDQLRAQVDDLLPGDQTLDDILQDAAAIDGVLVRSRTLTNRAGALVADLTGVAEALETKRQEIRSLITEWQTVRDEQEDLPEAMAERVSSLISRATQLETSVRDKLNGVIELQNETMAVSNAITPIAERIRDSSRSRQISLLEVNAAPIWDFTTENLATSSQRSSRTFFANLQRDLDSFGSSSGPGVGGHLLLLPLLVYLLVKLKQSAREPPSAAFARPVATAVLIWMLIGVVVYAGAPISVRTLYVFVAMVVATIVLIAFLPKNLRGGVIGFVIIALIERLISALPAVEHLPRLVYMLLGAGVATFCYAATRVWALDGIAQWGAPRAIVANAARLATGVAVIGVIADAIGYVYLSHLLISALIGSIVCFLVLFAGLRTIGEIITVALGLRALDGVRSIANNRMRVRRALQRPLVWIAMFLWLWVTARAFQIDRWLIDSLLAILNAEMSVGEVTLSLRGIVVFVLAVWLAVWASRIVRTVLNQDLLPRMELPRGVPNTISMTAHYSILLIGLLLGVGFMGINLSSFAFIVGALGVGIGFGLQNVVNNFVSGLILIFEAPIQVGDTVEVGPLMGKVVQIGIRTSRVRTFSGSEVIVPNGDLVSNQVVNWTLSDRRRRLELDIGVAYGSDPDEVTALLKAVADADEHVLDDPAPIILFNEFGDSSLNFRLLVWIAEFDQGFPARHQLNTAINNALAEAGIEIPFPQRDLYLKSLPEGFNPA